MGQSGGERTISTNSVVHSFQMNDFLVFSIFLVSANAAPPIIEDPPKETTIAPSEDLAKEENTVVAEIAEITTPSPEIVTGDKPEELLSGKERFALIGHLGQVDLRKVDKLILTPRQQLAISQELELQELGLPSYHDPTPWERLTEIEKLTFNEKYRSLSNDLQEFARKQFLSSPDDILIHAFRMFVNLDSNTLSRVLTREVKMLSGNQDKEDVLPQNNQVQTPVAPEKEEPNKVQAIKQQEKQQPQRFSDTEIQRIKARMKIDELPRNSNGFRARQTIYTDSSRYL